MTNTISFLALETSATSIENAKLIALGIVTSKIGSGLEEYSTSRWSTYLHPSTPIEPEVSARHYISNLMVKDAPIVEEWDVVEPVREILSRTDHVCVFNAGYAQAMISKYSVLTGLLNSVYDGLGPPMNLQNLAHNVWPQIVIAQNRLQVYRYEFELDSVINHLHPEHTQKEFGHTVVQKAWITEALLLRAMFETRKSYSELLEFSRTVIPAQVMTFGRYAGTPITELVTQNFKYIQSLWAHNSEGMAFDSPDVYAALKPYMEN